MSTPNGPARRRRIAGEPAPEAKPVTAPKPAVRRTAKKPPAKAAPAKATPAKTTPVERAVPAAPAPSVRPAAAPGASGVKLTKPVASESGRRDRLSTPSHWRRLLPFIAIAVAAVAFAAVFAVRGIAQYRDQNGLDASNAAAASAAGKAVETIFSFTYTELDEHLSASGKLMTPKFKKEFEKIAPALTDLAPQRKIQIKAMAQDAAATVCASDCSSAKASVLVFFDQARLIGDSTTPTVFGNRIIVDMVKQHGTWLVNNIKAL